MVKLETPEADLNSSAYDFNLKGTDEKYYTLADVKGKNGTVIMFICNHCPYVQKIMSNIIEDNIRLLRLGVNFAAIMPNDVIAYPEDSFDNMQRLVKEKGIKFPYLIDETQEVAKAYGAVCTPDFFGFNKELKLQYRGRINNNELFEAMKLIAETLYGPEMQYPSIGCSIKWKEND